MEITKENRMFMANWSTYGIGRKYLFAPIALIEDPELSSHAKILFVLVNSYSKMAGFCFANNDTLSAKLGLKRTMLKKYLKELEGHQLIDIKFPPSRNFKRVIYINFDGLMTRYPKLPDGSPTSSKKHFSTLREKYKG